MGGKNGVSPWWMCAWVTILLFSLGVAGNITVLQWIGGRAREVCCAVHIDGLCKRGDGMDYALPALALLLVEAAGSQAPSRCDFCTVRCAYVGRCKLPWRRPSAAASRRCRCTLGGKWEEVRLNFRARLLQGAGKFHCLLLLFSSGHRMPTAPSLVGLYVLIFSPSRSSCNVDKKYICLAREGACYSVTWMAEKKYTYMYISTCFIWESNRVTQCSQL